MAAASSIDDSIKRSDATAQNSALRTVPKWLETDWYQALSDLMQQPERLNPQQRLDWLLAIREKLAPNAKIFSEKTLRLMAQFSGWLCDWPLQTLLLLNLSQLNTTEKEQLAYAYWKQGDQQTALKLLHRFMLETPAQTFFHQDYQQLLNYSQQAIHYPHDRTNTPLRLEPLAEHHLLEFKWQYIDPSIASLCNLPDFETDQQWLNWLAQQQALNDQFTFAVMHDEWGFIGVVSLVIEYQCGFFYYWLGKDFQGQGYGPAAINLLLEWGVQHYAIDCCYAKVYQHNLPSQKALEKMGFKQLPFRAVDTTNAEYFYYLGDDKPLHELGTDLAQLFVDMGTHLTLNIPVRWSMGITNHEDHYPDNRSRKSP